MKLLALFLGMLFCVAFSGFGQKFQCGWIAELYAKRLCNSFLRNQSIYFSTNSNLALHDKQLRVVVKASVCSADAFFERLRLSHLFVFKNHTFFLKQMNTGSVVSIVRPKQLLYQLSQTHDFTLRCNVDRLRNLNFSHEELKLAVAHEFGHIMYRAIIECYGKQKFKTVFGVDEHVADIMAILLVWHELNGDISLEDVAADYMQLLQKLSEKSDQNERMACESHPSYQQRIFIVEALSCTFSKYSDQLSDIDSLLGLVNACFERLIAHSATAE